MRLLFVILGAGIVALAAPAMATDWVEAGDAGDLPLSAQIPVCTDALTSISGDLSSGTDADMYCIHIGETPPGYSATTCDAATTILDTQLWLFDAGGSGLSHNDDMGLACEITNGHSVLNIIQPGPGDYLLAVTAYDLDPLNSDGAQIWADSGFTDETAPDGGVTNIVVASWGGAGTATGHYKINLTGVSCGCRPTPVQPTTWGNIKSIYNNN